MRRSSAETKAVILAAARERFAQSGFERATIRAIAADANIDPSMVMRYFGNKDQLFAAAADFDLAIPDLSDVGRDQTGARLVAHFVDRWERDEVMVVLLRSSTTNADAAQRMQRIFATQLSAGDRRNQSREAGTASRLDRNANAGPGPVPLCAEAAARRRYDARRDRVVVGADYSAVPGVERNNEAMPVRRNTAVVGRRCSAALAATSAALHSVMLAHAPNVAFGVLVAGMALACLYCACELWRNGTLRAWFLVAMMNLAMIALHLPVPGHHHGDVAGALAPSSASTIMTLAVALSVVEVAIAVAVLYYRTREAADALGVRPRDNRR